MNTVLKGNDFEDKVYRVIKELIENEELPITKKRSLVFQKKRYYSKVRKDYIIFDITIEIFLPNQTEYSMLWIIECKDYKQPIPVNRIQTFKAQIDEVAGHKGIFISTSKYQRGAINTAKSYGIGLAIMQPDDSLYWTVQRIDSAHKSYDNKEIDNIFYNEEIPIQESFVAIEDNNRVFNNIVDYFYHENLIEPQKQDFKVPYLKIEEIESIALSCFGKNGIREFYKVSSEEIVTLLKGKYNIEIITSDKLNSGELGKLDLKKNKIFISPNLEYNSPRWRFTLAHELGHVVLHKAILTENGHYITTEEDLIDPLLLNARILAKPNLKRIEYQANLFASYVLLPNYPMGLKLTNIMLILNMEFTPYRKQIYYDDNPKNNGNCDKIFKYISKSFDVSVSVVKYRLIELNLLIDNSHSKSIYSVYKDILNERLKFSH